MQCTQFWFENILLTEVTVFVCYLVHLVKIYLTLDLISREIKKLLYESRRICEN